MPNNNFKRYYNNGTTTITFTNGNVAVLMDHLIVVICNDFYDARNILEKEYGLVSGDWKKAWAKKVPCIEDVTYLIEALK